MKNFRVQMLFMAAAGMLVSACQSTPATVKDPSVILHDNQDQLTQVIIYDGFTPPVASRIYVYASLAAYEAVKFSNAGASSITEKLHGFQPIPQPDTATSYDFTLAATKAFSGSYVR